MEVYKQNDCIVVSDEIWSDIILDDHKHIPLQSINEDAKKRTIALYAVSKTFNLAGLIGSYHVIYDSYIKDRVRAQSSKSHYNSMNVLSMHALIGAYSNTGKEWKDELNQVISKNVDYAIQFINNKLKGVQCTRPEGTYMLFIDCKEYLEESNKTLEEVLNSGWDVGIGWQDGRQFLGNTHIRINLALPLSKVKEAFDRMKKYVFI